MRDPIQVSASAAIIWICASSLHAQSSFGHEDAAKLRDLISEIEAVEKVDVTEFIDRQYTDLEFADTSFKESDIMADLDKLKGDVRNVDYGFVVKGSDGATLDVFGPETPIVQDSKESAFIEIEGYKPPPNATIELVGTVGYNKELLGLVDQLKDSENSGKVEKSVSEVSRRADRATKLVALEQCPDGIFPTEIKLYMDAGFDFVVVNSQTGSEIMLRMSEVCENLLLYLTSESARLKLQELTKDP